MTAATSTTPDNLVPATPSEATERLARLTSSNGRLAEVPPTEFLRGWNAVFYLHPGLHPDGFDEPESGWPASLNGIAEEACRRLEAHHIDESDFYCADAGWAGLHDDGDSLSLEEADHRRQLALIK